MRREADSDVSTRRKKSKGIKRNTRKVIGSGGGVLISYSERTEAGREKWRD